MFWIELPEQRRLYPNFVKLRTPGHLWILLVLLWCKWLLVCNDVPGGYLGCYSIVTFSQNGSLVMIQQLYRYTLSPAAKPAFQTTMSRYNFHCIVTQLGSSPTIFCTFFFFFIYAIGNTQKYVSIHFFSHSLVHPNKFIKFILFNFLQFYSL